MKKQVKSKSPIFRQTNQNYSPISPISKTHNYAEKTVLMKEVEYWKLKYIELEEFCKGKSSYLKIQTELDIWKSKYQQLIVRARVAKGSELIIQEYQSRIAELSQQIGYSSISDNSHQQQLEHYIKQDLNEQIELQQQQIRQLTNQLEEMRKMKEYQSIKDTNYTLTNKLQLEIKKLSQDNEVLQSDIVKLKQDQEKIHDYYQNQLKDKEFQLEQERLKLVMHNDSQKSESTVKIQKELSQLKDKFKESEKLFKLQLNQKDEHYSKIIIQLKSQIQNQIQSGEMRLSTLQSLMKDQQKQNPYTSLVDIKQSKQSDNEYSYQLINPEQMKNQIYEKSADQLGIKQEI